MGTAISSSTRQGKGAERNAFSGSARRQIRTELAAWFRANGRDLPWRRTTDAYAVLVSEFMCQQTQVATVVDYYERWMRAFPAVRSLAEADEQAVLGHWQGLGYYSRARNLHRAARMVMERHDGEIPADPVLLKALPGVGDYTAAAVMAFAFDRPAAVVDANVARVLARLCDYREPIDSARGKAFLHDAAAGLQAGRGGAREFNSALMELGAIICKPRTPLCPECPIRDACRTRAPEALPIKRARPVVTMVTERRAFISDGERVFLAQSSARWRGMWMLPEVDEPGALGHVEIYPITRYRVRMEVVRMRPPEDGTLRAFPLAALDAVPIPSPHRRVIRALATAGRSMHRAA
ncbi:MAG: A/G-specific adenine glycosylase [Terrimicrobiaceae bacterium]|nr:A/G-specific adenine glycosylase [Terrimicrobiaceae bacterium]